MASWDEKDEDHIPMQRVIDNVKKMVYDNNATKIAKSQSLAINTVSYEDCARNKLSVWGPCISDMTLQVNDQRMPVIREPNYSDTTWDVETDKIPLVVGNEDSNPGAQLKTVSLREYLENFNDYMSTPPKNGNKKINLIANDIFAKQNDKHVIMSSQCCFLPIEKGKETKFNVALFNYQSKKQDPAVLVIVSTSKGTSAQIIEGNEQKLLFNNYGNKADFIGQRLTDNRIERNVSIHGAMTKQEKQDNCIVIIQIPLKQKPKKVHVNHTQIQYNYIPNPQYPQYPQYPPLQPNSVMMGGGFGGGYQQYNNNGYNNGFGGGGYQQQQQQQQQQYGMMQTACSMNNQYQQQAQQQQQPQQQQQNYNNDLLCDMMEGSNNNNNNNQNCDDDWGNFDNFSFNDNSKNMKKKKGKKKKKKEAADVEAAIIKIAPKTIPICKCGGNLDEVELRACYPNSNGGVSCDGCSKSIKGQYTKIWHCPLEKTSFKHVNGFDLCSKCGEKQLKFEELNGMNIIERDTRYPIRVTLQYYKSTNNGILDSDIMKAIKNLLIKSQKQADYIGSLVTDFSIRSTEPDLITKNKTKVVHHINTVKVNVPVPVYPHSSFPGMVTIVNQPAVIINDPFESISVEMKNKVNHGKYTKIVGALKNLNVKDWDKYLNNFKNEEVTDNDLSNLCRDDLLELIPKMGPRNRFLKWLQSEYPKDNTDTNFMNGFL